MTTGELLSITSQEGGSRGRLNYAVQKGVLGPVPLDGAGNRFFKDHHLLAFREHLRSPRKRGRKPRQQSV